MDFLGFSGSEGFTLGALQELWEWSLPPPKSTNISSKMVWRGLRKLKSDKSFLVAGFPRNFPDVLGTLN